jgi:hypothetical protein
LIYNICHQIFVSLEKFQQKLISRHKQSGINAIHIFYRQVSYNVPVEKKFVNIMLA